jgi:disulfide bond formation protein DsbB
MVQRLSFVLVGITTLLAFIINPGGFGVRVFAGLTGIFAGLGVATAARQIWLQHLPADKVPECGPDLYFMLESYPISEALIEIISGSGECAKVSWTLLGFSIPEWAIVIFIGIFSVSASIFVQHENPKPKISGQVRS